MLAQEFIPITNDPNSDKKRAIRISRFIIDFSTETMMITTFLSFFEQDTNETDQYGKKVKLEYEKTLTASNNRKVNPVNGKVCVLENDVYKDVDDNVVTNPMGQYEFYLSLAYTMPVIVMELIRQLIIDEDIFFHTYDKFSIYEN